MLTLNKPEATVDQPQTESPKPKLTSLWIKLALAAVVVGGSVATWYVRQTPAPQAAQSAPALPPRPVEITPLQAGTGIQTLDLIGEVVAADQATVRSQTSGVVRQVFVNVGDSVRPGQPIAILDTADQDLARAQARATLASARSELARLETGTRVEVIAQRQAELQAARAREQEAQTNLNNLGQLMPDLIAQRQAEVDVAEALEIEALDNRERTRDLTTEGALSQRSLVEAEANARSATSNRLRAIAALTAQQTENQQTLAQAQALLDTATSERLRLEALLAEATEGPRQEEIAAQQGIVEAAEAAVAQAQLELERATITTDATGYVSERPVNVGDYIQRNDPILTMVNRERLDVFLELPEDFSGRVGAGELVNLAARALPNWNEQVEIAGVVPTANTASRRQLIRVRLDQPPAGLLPGMAINGSLEMATPEAQFVISRDALTRQIDQWVVFAIDHQNQAQQIPVQMVADMGHDVAIASVNLQAGQPIVIRGGDGLVDGAAVQIIEVEAFQQDEQPDV